MLDIFTIYPLIDLWLAEDIGHGDQFGMSFRVGIADFLR